MKKIVIALVGKKDRGKTTTLKELANLCCDETTDKIVEKIPFAPNDQRVLLIKKDLRIGITTPGDNINDIEGNFDFFKRHQCNICITAVRIGHNYNKQRVDLTIEKAKAYSAHYVQIMKVKLANNNQEELEKNQEMAEMLKNLVDYYAKKNK